MVRNHCSLLVMANECPITRWEILLNDTLNSWICMMMNPTTFRGDSPLIAFVIGLPQHYEKQGCPENTSKSCGGTPELTRWTSTIISVLKSCGRVT